MQVNGGSNYIQPVPQGSDNRTIISSLVNNLGIIGGIRGIIGGIISYLELEPNAHDFGNLNDLQTRLMQTALRNINNQRNIAGDNPYDFPLDILIGSFEWGTQLIDVVNIVLIQHYLKIILKVF